MNKKLWFYINSASTPWYLAKGTIPASTNYTVYDPLLAADLASSYSNLANPGTRNAAPGVAPTFSSGWVFNGSTQYLNTGAPDLATSTIVLWVQAFESGVYAAGSNKLLIRPLLSPGSERLTWTSNSDLLGYGTSSVIILRPGLAVYRNGISLGAMSAYPAGTNYNILLGCRNNAGTPTQFGAGTIYRYAHYDFLLSNAQCAALSASVLADVNPSASSYEATMIASNPLVYFPMNKTYGTFDADKMGTVAGFNGYNGVTTGFAGPTGKGLCMKGVTAGYCLQQNGWPAALSFNFDEASVACWIYNNNSDIQARPMNGWTNGITEYFAPEIRNGSIAIFSLENGVAWNTGAILTVPNATWFHLVMYNSKSAGKCGIYVNGTKYDYTKGTSGFSNGVSDTNYPFILQSMTGYACHYAFYSHALSQSEVNAINV